MNAPPSPVVALDVVRRAYRLSTHGQRIRAQRLLPPGSTVEDGPDAFSVSLMAGEVARRAGFWSDAAVHFAHAASIATSPDENLCATALEADSRILAGDIDAVGALDQSGADAPDARVRLGLVEMARGRLVESRLLLKDVRITDAASPPGLWLETFQAELLLDLNSVAGASQSLAKLEPIATLDRFSELALRRHWLRAWFFVRQATGADADDVDAREAAQDALRTLRRYAEAFPLYQARAAMLNGKLSLALGEVAGPHFEQALTAADRAMAPFLRARLAGDIVGVRRRATEAGVRQLEQRAKDELLSFGASGRVAQLGTGRGRGNAPTGSVMSKKSIALRLEAAQLTDASGLEAVIEVTRHLSAVRDLDELFEKILDSVTRVLHADRGVLLKRDDAGETSAVAARGLSVEDATPARNEISFGVVQECDRTGEAVLSDNALSDARFQGRASVLATEIRSVLCAPIRTAHRTFGFVYLDRRMTEVPFDEDHQELLAVFCVQVAVAWENAMGFEEIERLNTGLERKVKERTVALREANDSLEKYIDELENTRLKLAEAERDALEKEMSLARDIQYTLIPPPDAHRFGPLSVTGLVEAASYCGGDFWGYVLDAAGDLVVVVADVTGHGVAAALITGVVRSSLDTIMEIDDKAQPDRILSLMNRAVCQAAKKQLCCTAFCAVVDAQRGQIRFSNAGHNFPFLQRIDGTNDTLAQPGIRLGENPKSVYEPQAVPFAPGERLLLFTDGIVEWPNPKGREFGVRRLKKSMAAHRALSGPGYLDALRGDAETFAKGELRDDDLTLVVVDWMSSED